MGYLVIGHTAALLHFLFLGYVVFGGFLAWKRPKAIRPHLLVAAYALGIIVIDWPCVLTELENWARAMGGRETMPYGFIDHYLTGTLYPREHLLTSRVVMGAVVAASWVGAAVLGRRARGAAARVGSGPRETALQETALPEPAVREAVLAETASPTAGTEEAERAGAAPGSPAASWDESGTADGTEPKAEPKRAPEEALEGALEEVSA